jgi:hypothetical protein
MLKSFRFPVVAAAAVALMTIFPAASGRASEPAGATPPPLPMVKVKNRVTDAFWRERAPRTPETLDGFTNRAFPEPRLNPWGGRTDRKTKATGFFRIEKQGDRWWLVDPDGGLYIHAGVAGVSPGKTPTNQAALKEKFGTPDKWSSETARLLRDMGFSGAGAWSDVPLLRGVPEPSRMVYTVIGIAGAPGMPQSQTGGFMSTFGKKQRATSPGVGHTNFPNSCIPVFHPDFPAHCDEFAKPLAGLKDDRWLLGYFSDNELPMPRLEKYLELPPNDPAMGSSYQAAKAWLDSRKGKNATLEDVTAEDKEAFSEFAYERYLSLTTSAIRKYDPNHLCLGPRYYSIEERNQPGVFRVAGKYLDVIGVNYYFVWNPDPRELANWAKWAGKPVMITEWYAKGMDSGFPNNSGAGWTVPTQEDRGLFYQTFTLGLLESKACVGWHWFKYMDNDPTDPKAEASNVDANKGMVTNRFEAYGPLIDRMRSLNQHVYGLADYFDRKTVAKR